MRGMQLTRLAERCGLRLRCPPGQEDVEITGVAFDSREVVPGDIFCCVPGARFDGHDHAAAAVTAGARALLCEHPVGSGVCEAVVDSVRAAMGLVAAAVYGDASRELQVAGITGTNGKTTTTFMLESVLSAAGRITGLTGTVETHVAGRVEPVRHTTPEAPELHRLLRRMRDAGVDAVAMEVSSHALDQHRVGGVHFAVAAFTNLSQDHLDYHATMEDYFAAKARLFTPELTEVAVVCVDDAWGRQLVAGIGTTLPVITYTATGQSGADVAALDVAASMTETSFMLHLEGRRSPKAARRVRLPVGGAFNAANAACAAACAGVLGVGVDDIVTGLEAMPPVPGRFEPVTLPPGGGGLDFAVVVDYAHTPDGLDNVLRAARDLLPTGARLICVFGCGGDRDKAKRPLMGAAAARHADVVVVTSDNPRSEDPAAIIADILPGIETASTGAEVVVEPDRAAAIRVAVGAARSGDVVVVAGKGHERRQEIGGRIVPFDDRAVARAALGELVR
jgi:UDP-N-acetylmuramoyl-L-alanyl-D-glutamate--2,6-diaminopimelate ligase